MKLLYCIVYILSIGTVASLLGRLYPRKWFRENKFPFKSFKWEKDGQIYRKINIHKWKTKVPDMSVIINKFIPGFMPVKRLNDATSKEKLQILAKESCVSEFSHCLCIIAGFYCLKIWKKIGGVIMAILNTLWHLQFVLIQRYNRPRLLKSISRMQ